MGKVHISLEQLKLFHQEFDARIAELNTVCSKGCAYCCHQWVPVTSFEVNYIKDAVKSLPAKIKTRVKRQYFNSMAHFMVNTPDRFNLTHDEVYRDYAKLIGADNIPCPLLIDNTCSIYEMRPFTCQLHFQLDDPKLCKQNKIRDADTKAMHMMSQFITFILQHGEFHLVPVLMILRDVFDKKNVCKKIENKKLD